MQVSDVIKYSLKVVVGALTHNVPLVVSTAYN